MKKIFTISILAIAACLSSHAQVGINAYNLAGTQLRGTARFVGMGGAFTSLGGDVSCMTQNPAGLGLYRHSDIALTFDFSFRNYTGLTNDSKTTDKEKLVKFDNFAYVGVFNLDKGPMYSLQWGLSYNRNAVFDRISSGYCKNAPSSMTNYVASFTDGKPVAAFEPDDLTGYDPYYDPYFGEQGYSFYPNWLSTLMNQSHMMTNIIDDYTYTGLYNEAEGSHGDAEFSTRERGYSDEYNISFAGNVSDILYWGFDIGIVDMAYQRETTYSEIVQNAYLMNTFSEHMVTDMAEFSKYSYSRDSGNGGNLKFGVIVRPVDMLKIGLSVHTPTWLSLNHTSWGSMSSWSPAVYNDKEVYNDTPDNVYNWRCYNPWRLMVGASVNLGNFGILSVDYERVAYDDMKLKEEYQDRWGGSEYEDNSLANTDIKEMFKAANIVRAGLEARLNSHFKARAGFNWQGTAVRDAFLNDEAEVAFVGTDPSFEFTNNTYNYTLGLGYQYKAWYIDATWQLTKRKSQYYAFSTYDGIDVPRAAMTDTYNNIVISTGIRF